MLLLLHFKSSKKIELKIILEEREKKKKKISSLQTKTDQEDWQKGKPGRLIFEFNKNNDKFVLL